MSNTEKKALSELDLRDLIRVFWKKKWLIIIFTVAALVLGVILNMFVLPKQYLATASVTITPQSITPVGLADNVTISNPLNLVESPTKPEYINRMKSAEVLQAVVDELSLSTTVDALNAAITISEVPSTGVINISVIYSDPDHAKQIANTLAAVFSKKVTTDRQNQLADAQAFAEEQYAEARVLFDEMNTEYIAFQDEHDLTKINADITRLSDNIQVYLKRKTTLKTEIAANEAFLDLFGENVTFQNDISAEDIRVFLETAADTSDSLNQTDIAIPGGTLPETMVEFDYVQSQLNLLSATTELNILDVRLSELEEQLGTAKDEYALYSDENELLSRSLFRQKGVYLAYNQRNSEIAELIDSDTSAAIVRLVSEATAGTEPVSPAVLRNIIIAVAIGFALSVGIVYFKDFWWIRGVDNKSENE